MNNLWKKKLVVYLKLVKENQTNNLSLKKAYKIFDLARQDFLKGKLELEDFCVICDKLWGDSDHQWDPTFDQMLLTMGELPYYIRHINEETAKIVSFTLLQMSKMSLSD